jgi:hypothetical protein
MNSVSVVEMNQQVFAPRLDRFNSPSLESIQLQLLSRSVDTANGLAAHHRAQPSSCAKDRITLGHQYRSRRFLVVECSGLVSLDEGRTFGPSPLHQPKC